MSGLWTQEFKDAYSQLQELAATDANFRSELLADANAAIEKVTGGTLPEGFTIKVIDQDPNYSVTIALPPLENAVGDEALGNVAGGYQSPLVGGVEFEPNVIPLKVIGVAKVAKVLGYGVVAGVGRAVGQAAANAVMNPR